jgi:hypothetical protein
MSSDQFRNPFKASTRYIEGTASDDDGDSLDSDVPLGASSGHRDTLALLRFRDRPVPAITLPSELLQLIYLHLSPSDFDTVRHTCSKLFLASLDKSLLHTMTRRAGCAQAAEEDFHQLRNPSISEEWLLSKRLATEARVTPGKHSIDAAMTVREIVNFEAI